MATNGSFIHQEQYKAAADPMASVTSAIDGAAGSAGNSNLSKDEVGWYFVEQFYTTLSKSPEKLHLYYGKRSQFVYGREAEVANVSVGRSAIQERIKQLDFQDCKVRVSNVDSQASDNNIVIQVIGETSNKAAEPKKFCQTFILAQQPSGYFVLNDILRYIDEDSEESVEASRAAPAQETEAAAEEPAPAVQPEAAPAIAVEAAPLEASVVDHKLEEVKDESAPTNGIPQEVPVDASKTAAETKPALATLSEADTTATQIAEEDVKEPEKPKDPSPTPAKKPAQPVEAAAPAEPTGPPKPMTWASRAAAAAGPRPVVPLPKTATPPAASQPRAPAPAAAASAPAATAPAAHTVASPTQANASVAAPTAPAAKESSGWQTAGAESKRQNRPQSISSHPADKDSTMGYVKYVTDKVQEADLKNALEAHGELTYFDINRLKNCAFVEYKTTEGYQAAVAANPQIVNGENIVVEPRRPKSTAYGGSNYSSGRGGASGRGRGGFEGNRGQGGARGGASGQNRGRGGMGRGGRA